MGKSGKADRRALPPDYKGFIDRYGLGRIAEFVSIFTPFSGNRHANLGQQAQVQSEALRELGDMLGALPTFPMFPAPAGLLSFGGTDNGDILFWRTEGRPQDWSIVIGEARGPVREIHAGPMTALLADYLAGRIATDIMPSIKAGLTAFRRVPD